jgi:hypothetical protein
MITKEYKTVRERLFWSYANLAMAHTAVERKQDKYAAFNYMIRARLFKGLIDSTMNIRTLFDDEKIKLLSGQRCSYCGSTSNLALDHIFPQKYGGKDIGDNLIYACRSCNSSKGKKDIMQWMNSKGMFPPLMILRRYLKLIIEFCIQENLMDSFVEDLRNHNYPFNIELVPIDFPKPSLLKMTT